MMVTFVSQCEKKALNRTRKVLDAFADRIGSNTWQTVITQEGLLAVKKSLRKTASKNTAVSCHWLRSRSRSELVWVVGQRDKFNSAGVVPVNSTQRNILQSQIENDWAYLPLIKALVALSALLKKSIGSESLIFNKKRKQAQSAPPVKESKTLVSY
jgi:CRISPR-associated endonuclease/helicase Cas3